ncbi:MAG: nitrite reductase small subunit NirD [Hyphomicrobiaceae bacterium]
MSAERRGWVHVGTMDDVPRRGSRCVRSGELTIAVFRTHDDRVFALEDKCPHKHGRLSEGIVHGDCVTCPLHNWVISLETGAAQGADQGSTITYPVRLSDGQIFIDLALTETVAEPALPRRKD